MTSNSTVPSASSSIVNDEGYYCQDLVLQVENVRFRVPRAIFDQSEVFKDMFCIPAPDDVVEGSDDEHPLILHGYLAEDFRQLLRVIMPLSYEKKPSLSPDQWISVLKVSTAWEIPGVRQAAIDNLAEHAVDDPILRLILSKSYRVPQWFVPAINTLARRSARLEYDDIERMKVLGDLETVFDLALKVSWVRETYVGQRSSIPHQSKTGNYTPSAIKYRNHLKIGSGDSNRCGRSFYCEDHGLETDCHGEGSRGGSQEDRSAHDFTEAICKIFKCEEDGEPCKEFEYEDIGSSSSPSPHP